MTDTMDQTSSDNTPSELPPDEVPTRNGITTKGNEPSFDWDELVPRLVHPLKVATIEALWWIELPLSPSELTKVFEGKFLLGVISYHARALANVKALKVVGERPVRGAVQHFYFFPARQKEAARYLRQLLPPA